MSDNTGLPLGSGGDTFRTLDKTGTGAPKTEVVGVDLGGARREVLLTSPIPASLVDVPVDDDAMPVFSFSPTTMDALEKLFRRLMAAAARVG